MKAFIKNCGGFNELTLATETYTSRIYSDSSGLVVKESYYPSGYELTKDEIREMLKVAYDLIQKREIRQQIEELKAKIAELEKQL